ncbi:MAG: hypothetical protein ACJAU1_001919, partial [Psychromonas sp.]
EVDKQKEETQYAVMFTNTLLKRISAQKAATIFYFLSFLIFVPSGISKDSFPETMPLSLMTDIKQLN